MGAAVWRRWLLCAALLAAPLAQAHLMPAQQGTVNVVGPDLFVVLSVPAAVVPGADDDHDGRLSAAEIGTHAPAISARVGVGLRFDDGGQPAVVDFINLLPEPDERNAASAAGAQHLLVLMKLHFPQAPKALHLHTDLFAGGAAQQFTLRARLGQQVEAAVLNAAHPEHRFFRTPLEVGSDYLRLGIEHILLGADHLLFLLTIVVAGAGLRYWLAVLTSFTLAHSLTLTASSLGWVQVSPRIVEPLIAASIVLMAALNLWRAGTAARVRVALVFGCGLLHGLGFASALEALSLQGWTRVASLVGFNLGIELGQAAFVAALLLGTLLARSLFARLPRPVHRWPSLPRAASWIASVVGSVWFVQRLTGG